IIKVFGEAFSKKLQKDAAFFDQKVAPENFSCFLSRICFQTHSLSVASSGSQRFPMVRMKKGAGIV
ncbi:hypothetical protein, partial [Novacetimonas hansenii]|uniref:hypothetical protein n=1 Tax=Novacetimonas hansenii TaxID=436 RepID=UPI001A7EF54D